MPAGTCDTGGHFAFWARWTLHARRILGAHGHALEAIFHKVIIEVLAVELRNGNIRFRAVDALIPIIERLQRHNAIDQHNDGEDDGSRVAALPRNHVDELEQPRQQQLDPDEATQTPQAGEACAGTSAGKDGERIGHAKELHMRVAPRDHAKRGLHKPAHEHLKACAEQRAHQKDNDGVLFVEAVEHHGHEYGAKSVDGAEGTKQHAGAVLVDARVVDRHVPDVLGDQAEYAADKEYPEQVEVVEFDVAFAGLVAAEHALGGGVAIKHFLQAALQLALLAQRGVDGGRKRDEDAELDGRAKQEGPDALEHHVNQKLDDGKRDKDIGQTGGIAALVLDKVQAKDNQDDGACRREHDAGDDKADRDERVVAELGGGVAVDERGDDLPHKGADRRERAHAGQDAQDGVHLNDEGDLLDLRGAGDAGVEFVSIHT